MPDHVTTQPCDRRQFLQGATLLLGASTGSALIPIQAFADTPEGSLDLGTYRGKVVYLDFWASWCAPCKLSFRFMEALRYRFPPRDLAIVTVNVDRKREAAQAFLQANHADLPVIYDPAGALAARYKVSTMPTSFVIDRSGQTRFVHNGYFDNKTGEYEEHVSALVDARS